MLKEKRKELCLTLSELAEKVGISESYMSKLEKHPHKCNANIRLILKLSEVLKVEPVKVFLFFINAQKL